MRYKQSVGGVVIGPKNKVLVVSQHGTSWSLIKGTIESGETPEQTVKREFNEEASLTSYRFHQKLGSYKQHSILANGKNSPNEIRTITIGLYTTEQEDIKPIDPENPEAKWVDPEKVAEVLTHPKDIQFYKSIESVVLEFIQQQRN